MFWISCSISTFTGSPFCVLLSHWFPSSHTTFLSCLCSFFLHFPNGFIAFTFLFYLPFTVSSDPLLSLPPSPPPSPGDSSLLTNFSITFSFHSPPPRFYFTSLISPSTPRAAVPGRAPPVQTAAGRWGRVLLRKLPVGSPQPWLCSHRGRAPTWWWSHCRGDWETALPNGGYARRLERHLFRFCAAFNVVFFYHRIFRIKILHFGSTNFSCMESYPSGTVKVF